MSENKSMYEIELVFPFCIYKINMGVHLYCSITKIIFPIDVFWVISR